MTLTRDSLKDYFIQGVKKPDDLQIGVEWEKIGVYRDTLKAIRYSGPRGVEAIFKAMIRRYGWSPVTQGPHVIALKKKGASITLEPGGQIELSGQKSRALDDNASELYRHMKEIREISDPMGIVWLGIGLQPVSTEKNIQWVPKKRYGVMRAALKNKGSMTYAMMKETASIQVSLDYTSEADAIEKLRLGFAVSPVLTAIFANSPISKGRLNGFYSKRAHIWRHTAPERTGIIAGVFDPRYNFDRYVDFALSVPMLFIIRHDRWIRAQNMRFSDFLKKGLGPWKPEWADWQLHLTTIFTEARLKQYVELRGMDCQKNVFGLSAAALVKGIFYDALAREKAWKLLGGLSLKDRLRLAGEVPAQGLKTRFKNHTVWEAACDLLELSDAGLKRSNKRTGLSGESRYLEPLKNILFGRKMTPAEILMECYKRAGSQQKVRERIVACAAI